MAPHYDDRQRWLRMEAGDGSEQLLATGFRGREAISELFRFTVTFVVRAGKVPAFDKILGQPMRLFISAPGSPERTIDGIVCALRQTGADADFAYLEAELVPHVWLLTKTVRSRIFQQMTVPEILAKVFARYAYDGSGLRANYPAHNYCVQYQESDFAFAARIMEEEGIHFYFRVNKGSAELTLSDRSLTNPELPKAPTIAFERSEGHVRPKGKIYGWQINQTLESGKYCVWDDQFQLPNQSLEAVTSIVEEVSVGAIPHRLLVSSNRDLEIYDHDPGFAQRFDAVGPTGMDSQADLAKVFGDNMRTAKIYMESESSGSLWIDGEGDCANLASGFAFGLIEHGSGDGKYLIRSVNHELTGVSYRTETQDQQKYRSKFVCQPIDLPYRPHFKAPPPRAFPQTAMVTGVEGEEIFTDAHGRIKVQFYWDREGKKNAHSSCWLRVIQPWAGSGYGQISLPRVGQEVMVDFVNGDPDAPFVLGSVYNPDQLPPRPLPGSRTQTVLKSQTKFGDSNSYNGFGMDDTPGSEHMQHNAQKYYTFNAKDSSYHNFNTEHNVVIGKRHTVRRGGLPGINYALTTGSPPGGSGQGPDPGIVPSPQLPASTEQPAGSGSGTGVYANSTTNSGPFSWNSNVGGDWAEAADITLGRKLDAVVGFSSGLTVGYKTNTVINPIGVISAFGSKNSDLWNLGGDARVGGLGAMGNYLGVIVAGNIACVVGTSSTAIYGPSFKVTRGYNQDIKQGLDKPAAWKLFNTPAAYMCEIYCIYRVAEQFLNLIQPTALVGNVVGFVGSALELVLLNIWYKMESVAGEAKALGDEIKKQEKAAAEAAAAKIAQMEKDLSLNSAFTDQVTTENVSKGVGAGTGGASVAEEDVENAEADVEGTVNYHVCDGVWRHTSPGISLISAPEADDVVGYVEIVSMGQEMINGVIDIYASCCTTIYGGDLAYISVESPAEADGLITINCGADGQIFLQNGLEMEPNVIMLCAEEGIVIESLLSVIVDVEEQIIMADPETGIWLSAFGENNILMAEDGITIMVGPSIIQLTDEGIIMDAPTISIFGDTEITLDSLDITLDSLDVMIDALALTVDALETTIL